MFLLQIHFFCFLFLFFLHILYVYLDCDGPELTRKSSSRETVCSHCWSSTAGMRCASTVDAKWLPAMPREGWIKATGCGIPMSLITGGKLCRGIWENPEVETLFGLLSVQSFNSPELQTSAVHFHLDQRAQPQFQACKHSETSAAESVIFPPRIFQVDILKQTLLCSWPHL